MKSSTDISGSELIRSSLWGLLRGICVHTLIYPLDVVKIRQQCSPDSINSVRIALNIFKAEGFSAFYSGLSAQLLKTSIKNIWCWPMITGIPNYLRQYHLGDLTEQAVTGVSIATVEAVVTTPLERARILSAYKGKLVSILNEAYKTGWYGISTQWAKLSVSWATFLVAQKYFRDKSCDKSNQQLSISQLCKVGVQSALVVSLLVAPFDIANTLKHTQILDKSHFFSRQGVSKLYLGWPLQFISFLVHNIATAIVLDKLNTS